MLKCDFGNLARDMALLEQAGTPLIHLDVMDGHFVPNLSYGPMVIERMRELTELPFEAHLMISEPERYLDDYLRAGCDIITFHIEAVPDPRRLIDRIKSGSAGGGVDQPGNTCQGNPPLPRGIRPGPGHECGARLRGPKIHARRLG
ncbi:MAG: hypothetical protein R3C12_12150 [Planctomycetaceae bacterium]